MKPWTVTATHGQSGSVFRYSLQQWGEGNTGVLDERMHWAEKMPFKQNLLKIENQKKKHNTCIIVGFNGFCNYFKVNYFVM